MMIRKAVVADMPLLLEQASLFIKELDTSAINPTAAYMEKLFHALVNNHILAVAETKDGKVAGMIGAIYTTTPLDDQCLLLSELFWWVFPEHRGTRAGWLLLKFLEEVAAHHKVPLVMSTLMTSPDVEKLLTRHGFVPAERTFIKWVSHQAP